MKINRTGYGVHWQELGNVCAGTAVRFKTSFHQSNCTPDDVFIVCSVHGSYRPDECHYADKAGVVNLESGKLSYVCRSREVEALRSEVSIIKRHIPRCHK